MLEGFVPWLADVLRIGLVLLALVMGTLLIVRQRSVAKTEAEAKKIAAEAALLKEQNDEKRLSGAVAETVDIPDASGMVGELVKGLSTSAPLLAGGIVLYILAGVLLGSFTLSVSADVGSDGSTGTSACEPATDPNC